MDALDEEEFNAVIEHISGIGNNVNGITTYDVTLELERDDRLFSGMNAASTIVIRQKDNVLLIPLEIIEEDENGEYVYIIEDKEGGGSERTRVDITTGISDGIYAEVTSGLSEGDMVNYEYVSAMEAAMMRFMGDVPNGRRRRGF
ncbi:MAG: macrolide transporter subunit MacA [Firmicutes bacterium ADurb.Bin182]|nr:MAG: macrolide transporter subunit MacA [Firmicutes bacterium ADurb.Bin182]